ncbi:MAG: four helix bundle protein [Anaerolineaceae bacterium]|jgi:four helix bundle protein|nr:four helix bundle protein [Anaerolineaceae bacterium]
MTYNTNVKTPSVVPTARLTYKDLIVWQKSIKFASDVIDQAENLTSTRKHYRLVEQLEAAATSVPMNIAEGKGRYSTKEYKHFLMIARGSLYETMTLLEIFELKNWIKAEDFQNLQNQSLEIARMLTILHRNLKDN